MSSFGETGEGVKSTAKEEAPSFCSQSLQNEGAFQKGLLGRGQRVTVKGEVHPLSHAIPLVVREGEGVGVVFLGNDNTPRLGVEDRVADMHLHPSAHDGCVRRVMGLFGDVALMDTVHMSDCGEDTETNEAHHGKDDEGEADGQTLAVFPHVTNEVHCFSPEMMRTAVLP
jgi:hypothetical protein